MLTISLLMAFFSGFSFILGFFMPMGLGDSRPKLQLQPLSLDLGAAALTIKKKKKDPLIL